MKPAEFDLLLERHASESLSQEEKEILTDVMRTHEWAQDRFIIRMALEADLKRKFHDAEEISPSIRKQRGSFRPALWAVSIASALVVFTIVQSALTQKQIATLTSSEGAAWESSLPTAPGSELTTGFLKLKAGIATIQFRSGAEVTLEAPAHLVLESPMRGRLLSGSAIIDVPESAIGFIIETPNGYAVDYGTQFAVSVDSESRKSTFEVLSGEISVHHPESGQSLRLFDKESAIASRENLSDEIRSGENGTLPSSSDLLRIKTTGREFTVIRSNEREGKLHPDFLMAKRSSFISGYDRRSLFAFDLSELESIESARLRLNQVPCGLGFATRLPEISTFSVFGVHTPLPMDQPDWESAPRTEKASRLGSFSISRGQQTGSFGIETEALSRFLKANLGKTVTFLLVRDTDEAEGNGLVHAFASSRHPEASGPILEIR